MAIKFTPEDLAEMAAFDAEVDADDTLTQEEWESSVRRDREAGAKVWSNDTRKAYYQTHKEQYNRNKRISVKSLRRRYGEFGDMIRAERKRSGKTVPELAKHYGSSVRTWYAIERGECIIRWESVREVLPGIGPIPPGFPQESR